MEGEMICKISRVVWLMAGFLLLFASNAFAQSTTGMILGSVYDSSGASVAGATVTITNADQNVVIRSLTTDESGQSAAICLIRSTSGSALLRWRARRKRLGK